MIKKLFLGILACSLVACVQGNKPSEEGKKENVTVKEYQHVDTSGDVLYWYIIYSHILGPSYNDSRTYYYSSPTRVTDFSGVSPTRATNNELPADVKEAVSEAQETASYELAPSQEPSEVTMDVAEMDAAYTEYAETQNAIDSANSDTTESTSSESSSSDSSSGDSGGGYSGGDSGGSDGGGGGGE